MDLSRLNTIVNEKTGMSTVDRQKSLCWLSRQNDLIVQDVFKLKKNYFHRIKSEESILDILQIDICSFYMAIKEMISYTKMANRKNRSGQFGFLRKIGDTRSKQLRKPRKKAKREKLLNLQGVIRNLIQEQNYSLRDVSIYLDKYHKFSISHTEIGKFYKTLIKEYKNAQE